jgi:hypothetical protein
VFGHSFGGSLVGIAVSLQVVCPHTLRATILYRKLKKPEVAGSTPDGFTRDFSKSVIEIGNSSKKLNLKSSIGSPSDRELSKPPFKVVAKSLPFNLTEWECPVIQRYSEKGRVVN